MVFGLKTPIVIFSNTSGITMLKPTDMWEKFIIPGLCTMILVHRMYNKLVSWEQSLTQKLNPSVTVPELGRGEYQIEIKRWEPLKPCKLSHKGTLDCALKSKTFKHPKYCADWWPIFQNNYLKGETLITLARVTCKGARWGEGSTSYRKEQWEKSEEQLVLTIVVSGQTSL